MRPFLIFIVCVPSWSIWYGQLTSVRCLRPIRTAQWILAGIPILCLALIAGVLVKLSSADVRTNPAEIASYVALGAAWLGGASLLFPFFGISARDDVLERSNRATLFPIVGALAGVTFAFAGGNIGNGPGLEAVIFSAALSSGLFFALWLVMEAVASWSDSITIDRDSNSGMRLSAVLAGVGLLCGWSVAGNWISFSVTAHDFLLQCWPGALLAAIATASEIILQRHREASEKLTPFVVVTYFFLAVMWITSRGRYE